MTDSSKHPLFDFGESEKDRHEKELQLAFDAAYKNYVIHGGHVYGL